jgi:hypothetical protein
MTPQPGIAAMASPVSLARAIASPHSAPASQRGPSSPQVALWLAALSCALYPDVVSGLRTFVFRDYGSFSFPLTHYWRESVWHGEWPLWNPLNNSGVPFLAQWNTMACYPPNLLLLVTPLSWSLGVLTLAHLVFAGLGMYRLAWAWTQHRGAAALAATAFALNGLTLSCLMWPHLTAAIGWMPWVIWTVQRACAQGGRQLVPAALAGGMQMLTGGPEIILFSWLIAACVCAADAAGSPGERVRALSRLPVLVLLVAALAAAQLLPFYELLAASQRSGDYASSRWALPAWGWANLVVPLFRSYESVAGVHLQPGQAWVSSYYLGIGTLCLALAASVAGKDERARWLGALTAAALVLALGGATPVYEWMRRSVPLLGFMNFPVKFMFVPMVCIPLLAALALSGLDPVRPSGESKRLSRWVLGCGAALVLVMGVLLWVATVAPLEAGEARIVLRNAAGRGLFLLGTLSGLRLWRWRGAIGSHVAIPAALSVLAALDVISHAPTLNPRVPRAAYDTPAPPAATDTLGSQGPRYMLDRDALVHFARGQDTNLLRGFWNARLAMSDNLNLLAGVPKLDGFFPLYLRQERDVIERLYFATNAHVEGVSDFLGIGAIGRGNDPVAWHGRPRAMPLATAGQTPVFADTTSCLTRMFTPEFDPHATVFLPPSAENATIARAAARVRIHPLESRVHRLRWQVETETPCWMVVAQTHFGPWRAQVSGAPARIWPANHAYQALEVPAGSHLVELRYEDRMFRLGLGISTTTLFALGLWWCRSRHTRRSASPGCP